MEVDDIICYHDLALADKKLRVRSAMTWRAPDARFALRRRGARQG
jgi:hypothetical protein